ncbi:hypothetical protein H0H92_006377 [Tricholoma furcatifolium]|nr:hypothetical protein H0H92_006377 [Tricholoma furcatifolium]
MDSYWPYILPLPILVLVYLKSRPKSPSISISNIAGPAVSATGILGNFWEYYHYGVGVFEFQWQEEFGAVYRFKALFGALQYIYQTAGTKWRKPEIRREFGRLYLGKGIAWAQGHTFPVDDDHKRHRKILTPAFGNIESRGMIPAFLESAERLCDRWRQAMTDSAEGTMIEVTDGISRATLDTIGDVGFKYRFGALDNVNNPLAQAYKSLLVSTFGLPSKGKIFAQHVLNYIPIPAFHVLEKLPSRSLQGLKNVAIEGDRVAMALVNERTAAVLAGADIGRDVLDVIVQANLSEDPKSRLSEEELSAQMRTIMVAARECRCHSAATTDLKVLYTDETTGNSIAFLLYELAKNSTAQAREALRLHPVVYGPFLQPAEDDVLPLSKPIKTLDGKFISSLPVGKGQIIHVSLSGYNRLKDIWGESAHDFVPERWINPDELHKNGSSSTFGVYSNLYVLLCHVITYHINHTVFSGNFVSGAQSCLGWKFAWVCLELQICDCMLKQENLSVFEIQAFLIKIVQAFEWNYPKDGLRVIRATSGVMAPVLEGQEEKGKQLSSHGVRRRPRFESGGELAEVEPKHARQAGISKGGEADDAETADEDGSARGIRVLRDHLIETRDRCGPCAEQ